MGIWKKKLIDELILMISDIFFLYLIKDYIFISKILIDNDFENYNVYILFIKWVFFCFFEFIFGTCGIFWDMFVGDSCIKEEGKDCYIWVVINWGDR